jgi:hypothetical protein
MESIARNTLAMHMRRNILLVSLVIRLDRLNMKRKLRSESINIYFIIAMKHY